MRPPTFLAALALAAALGAPSAGAPLPDLCTAGQGSLLDEAQDDAGSGHDAPDCRSQALALASDGYHWGFVGPSERAPPDPADWFAADMAQVFGQGARVMYGVAFAPTYYTKGLPLTPVHQPFALDVWFPGSAAPATLLSCGGTLEWPAQPGWTHLRLRTAPSDEALPCPATASLPGDAGAAPNGATYGFYFGCHPHCFGA